MGPSKSVALNVAIPTGNGQIKAALLGSAQNEIIYRVDGLPGHNLVAESTVGPFSTAANYGSEDFTVDIPAADNLVLSVQLNDAASHQPLAVGAVGMNLLSLPVSNIVVEMGSVTRTCYTLNIPNPAFTNTYAFSTDTLYANSFVGPGYDFQDNYSTYSSSPLTISDAQGAVTPLNTVAYLGNGDLVDFDYLPPASAYKNNSALAKGAPVSANDIFCLSLGTIPNGHAWLQVANPGNGPATISPVFRYRVNSTLTYFAYEQTPADIANTCSTLW